MFEAFRSRVIYSHMWCRSDTLAGCSDRVLKLITNGKLFSDVFKQRKSIKNIYIYTFIFLWLCSVNKCWHHLDSLILLYCICNQPKLFKIIKLLCFMFVLYISSKMWNKINPQDKNIRKKRSFDCWRLHQIQTATEWEKLGVRVR